MTAKRKIAVLVGSLRVGSNSRRIAQAIAAEAPAGQSYEIVEIGDLPFYNQDLDADPAAVPASWTRFRSAIASADAVLFVTPEYNRSIPGVLKNAIDHASRPYGGSAWAGKPAGIVGVSVGAIGTAVAQQHLRSVLAYLDMPALGQPEVFLQWKEGLVDDQGRIGEGSREFLQGWMDRFVEWLAVHDGRARSA